MLNKLIKEEFADQVYQRYLESAYLIESQYDDNQINNLFLSIEVENIGFNLNECNETC